jgi:hypothetical protein
MIQLCVSKQIFFLFASHDRIVLFVAHFISDQEFRDYIVQHVLEKNLVKLPFQIEKRPFDVYK